MDPIPMKEWAQQQWPKTPFFGEIGLDGSPPHRNTLPVQEVFSRAPQSAQRLGARVLDMTLFCTIGKPVPDVRIKRKGLAGVTCSEDCYQQLRKTKKRPARGSCSDSDRRKSQ
jgi:hypothetical protein